MPDIRGKVSLDASGWERGISGVKSSLGQIGPALGMAFSVGAITAFGRSIAQMGGQISDGARDAQLSTDAFQAFAGVMQDAGVKADKTASILGRFNATREEAVRTDGRAREAMVALGVSTDEMTGSTETLLEAVARGYKETGDYAALVDIFGQRDAPAMQEALEKLGVEGFGNLIDSMKEAGRVMDDDFIEALDRADDTIGALGQRIKIMTAEGISRLAMLGQTLAAGFKAAFSGEDGGIDWKKIAGQAFLPLQMMEGFRPDWAAGLEAAGDKVAELDAQKDQADEQRRAKRERQEKQDQERRRRVFEASEREGEARGRPAGAPRMARDAAVRADDLRRVGANVLGSGRIGGQSKEELIAKATQATAQSAEQTAQILARMERDGGGGAIF